MLSNISIVNDGLKQVTETIKDYGWNYLGVKGKLAGDVRLDEHLSVLATAQEYVDSSVSKTINVPEDCDWHTFKNVYMQAWKAGCKGCTTFREGGKKKGILVKRSGEEESQEENGACFIDPLTGAKTCAE